MNKAKHNRSILAGILSIALSHPALGAYYDNGEDDFLKTKHIGTLGFDSSSGVETYKISITDYISQGRVAGSSDWHQDYVDIFKFDAHYTHHLSDLVRRNIIPIRIRLSKTMQQQRETRGIEKVELIEKHPSGSFKKLAEFLPAMPESGDSEDYIVETKTALHNKDLGYEYYLVVKGDRNSGHYGKEYSLEIEQYDIGDKITEAADLGNMGDSTLWDDSTDFSSETMNDLIQTDNLHDIGYYRDRADLYKLRLPIGPVIAKVRANKSYQLNDTFTLELLKEEQGNLISVSGPFNAGRYEDVILGNIDTSGDYYIRTGFSGNTATVYKYSLEVRSETTVEQDKTKLAVSNPLERSCGVNSDAHCYDSPLSNGLVDAGAVYIYQHYPALSKWQAEGFIKSPNPQSGDNFGDAAFFTENDQYLAVSAPGEDNCGSGVGGSGTGNECGDSTPGMKNDYATDSGALYIFEKQQKVNAYGFNLGDNEQYVFKHYIKAPVVHAADNFGASLSTGNRIALVGAPGVGSTSEKNHNSEWLNEADIAHHLSSNNGDNTGAVFLYGIDERSNWLLKGAFRPLSLQNNYGSHAGSVEDENFGAGITNSGDGKIVAISAPGDVRCDQGNSDNGVYSDNGVFNIAKLSKTDLKHYLETSTSNCISEKSGSVWVYEQQPDGSYSVISYLKAPETRAGDFFGVATWMTSNGEYLAVGSPGNDSGISDTDGWVSKSENSFNNHPWTNTSKPNSGAVYLYKRVNIDNQTGYELVSYIKDRNGAMEGADFGASIFLNDDRTLIVGAPDAVYSQNSNTYDNGYVYLFNFDALGQLTDSQVIYPKSNANAFNQASRFGSTVLMKNSFIFIGEPGDDHCGAGVNGESLNIETDYNPYNDNSTCSEGQMVSNSGAVQIYDASSGLPQTMLKAVNPGNTYYDSEQFGGILASNASESGDSEGGMASDPMSEILNDFLCDNLDTGNPFIDFVIDSFVCDD
ncbi:hypothetical protein L1D31_08120 [Vibrio sp. Isolate23]|uniref:hypothetical protein n=1 Tax=Vibrio sp. Isolate23 TaxID=2908533 RepID=UPI001EFD3967|nr:hypothetical protein [Vibrio sp. Isolate23]MCG9682536.1 hypothetical protein [Vibrio sp. Isolate23]